MPARARGVKDPPRVRVRRGDDTLVTLDLGDVLIDLHTEERTEDGARARQILESIFQNLDADKNNSVSLAEVKNQEPFQSLFRLMDHNGDGQVEQGRNDGRHRLSSKSCRTGRCCSGSRTVASCFLEISTPTVTAGSASGSCARRASG